MVRRLLILKVAVDKFVAEAATLEITHDGRSIDQV